MNSHPNLGRRKVGGFTQQVSRPRILGPEHNPWFWNPNREGGRRPSPSFLEQLRGVGEELAVSWNPITSRWQIWMKAASFAHPICQGWKLLFVHTDGEGGYADLDNRVFARLFEASVMRWGSARAYFDQVQAASERDKERRQRQQEADTIDAAMPAFEHAQIQVSGFGKSVGSKFSNYLS